MAMSKEIWRLQHLEPFQPFTVHVSSGKKYHVRDPRRVFATGELVIVALKVGKDGVVDRSVNISPSEITQVTPQVRNGSKRRK